LIIDDNKDIVKTLFMRLEHEGYKVYVAFDTLKGNEEVINSKPDLILLDIMIPAGGGMSILENTRNNAKTFGIPTIIITAGADEQVKNRAEELGISGYFIKPVDIVKLLERIKEILTI
jgi:DNA-binding response OmpR family regulator